MNIANLSAKEVLRICAPETELEKKLFEMCDSLASSADEAAAEYQDAQDKLDNYECETCDETADSIRQAIDLIEEGRTADGLKILKAI